jgi:hypothetical protein
MKHRLETCNHKCGPPHPTSKTTFFSTNLLRLDLTSPTNLDPNPMNLHLLARGILGLARKTDFPRQRRVRIRPPGQARIPIPDLEGVRKVCWRRNRVVLVRRDVQAAALIKIHCRVLVPARRDDGNSNIGCDLDRELHGRGDFQATTCTENVGQYAGCVVGVGRVRGGHVVVEGRVA